MEMTFGEFLKNKRLEKNFSQRGFSKLVGISPVFLSNLENGTRSAPRYEILEAIKNTLVLCGKEEAEFFELAAKTKPRNVLAPDLVNYIYSHETAHKAIRLANTIQADDEDWQKFIVYLVKKSYDNDGDTVLLDE